MIPFLLGVLTGAACVYAWGAVRVLKRKVKEELDHAISTNWHGQ